VGVVINQALSQNRFKDYARQWLCRWKEKKKSAVLFTVVVQLVRRLLMAAIEYKADANFLSHGYFYSEKRNSSHWLE